jgi:hypothetical protein
MDREQIRARQTTIEAHVYSTSGKQGLWDALEHNAWMRNDISDLLAAIDDLEVVCAAWRRAASLAANDAADRKAAIDRVLALHTQTSDIEGSFCGHCSFDWPCETVRAVEHE